MIWLLASLVIALIVVCWWLFRPIPTESLVSQPRPAKDYPEALERFAGIGEAEDETGPLLDVCRSKLLTHGETTEHAIVFLHGYTNCPEQFAQLGQRFYDLGYNVLIPRMRYHGYEDRLTPDIRKLTAEDLVAYGDTAIDIARGLGHKVSVMGISGGGTVTAWLAQNRADVEYAMPLAAFIWLNALPAFLTRPLIRVFLACPNTLVWWDPRTKAENPYSFYHAYPRYALYSLAQNLRLGLAVKKQAQRTGPAAGTVLMITNAADLAVNNGQLEKLTETWQQAGTASVQTYQFEKELKMLHDIITPGSPGVPTEEVYDRLVEQVTGLHRGSVTE